MRPRTGRFSRWLPTAGLGSGLLAAVAFADIPLSPQFHFIGDLRGGYYSAERADRDGSSEQQDRQIARICGGLKWTPSERLPQLSASRDAMRRGTIILISSSLNRFPTPMA